MIKEPQIVVHETDEPDFIGDLFDADTLTRKNLTQVDLTLADANPPAGADHDGLNRAFEQPQLWNILASVEYSVSVLFRASCALAI